MSRYPLHYPAQHTPAHNPSSGALLKPNPAANRESQSPSDDGSTFHSYTKDELDLDDDLPDDPNYSLIAQTLNTDGTPKRPMNAFMIFARKRRPQVSAENQSMRTGEISKILSREWNLMEMSNKQYYLDQAKHLKDIFNSRYPDYVYRRRPNNSRRKRRPDTAPRTSDNKKAHGGEPGDESGNPDVDDMSQTDAEDPLAEAVTQDIRYGRLEGGAHSSYDAASHSSRTASYGYSPDGGGYRQPHGRMPYPSHRGTPPDLLLESPGPLSQPRHGNPQHSYPPSHQESHTHSPTMYDDTPSNTWDAPHNGVSRSHHHRTTPAGWISGATDRSSISNLGIAGERGLSSYPQVGHSHSSWTRSTSPGPRRASGAMSPSFSFPTLNSPFFPNQSHVQGNFGSSATSSSSSSLGGGASGAAPHYHSSNQHLGLSGRSNSGYDHRSYTSSPTPSEPYPRTSHSHRDLNHMYQQHQSHNSSSASMSPLSVSHLNPSSNTTGYWSRDKTDSGH